MAPIGQGGPSLEESKKEVLPSITASMVDILANAPSELIISESLKHEQAPLPVIHRFGPGIYIRECFIPKGTLIVGHVHKHDHMNIMLQGKMIFFKEDGSKTQVEAPLCFVSPPGRKSALALEDTVWQNIYATNETDIATLEAMLFEECEIAVKDDQRLFDQAVPLFEKDREDYLKALEEFGFTHDQVFKISQDFSDHIDVKYPSQKIKIDRSPIQGKGLFATAPILEGEVIYPARIDGKRTIAGRFTNHSLNPNAKMELLPNSNMNLVAIKDIKGCSGGKNGEEITIDYRQAMALQWKKKEILDV